MQTVIPSSPTGTHSRNSSNASSVGSVHSASDHHSRISATSSFDTPRTSISGSNPSEAALEPPPLDQAELEGWAPFNIHSEELISLGYRELWYRVAVNQVVALYFSC